MAELFAQMNALRVKHNLDNPSSLPAAPRTNSRPIGENKFTNKSLLDHKEKTSDNQTAKHSSAGATAVRTGTMGLRPGPRKVRWGENSSSVAPPSLAVKETAAEGAVQSAPVPLTVTTADSVRPILKAGPIVERPPAAVPVSDKPAPTTAATRPGLQGMRHGQVMERTNPTVMSEGAMMRKREVEVESEGSGTAGLAQASRAHKSARANGSESADSELVEKAGRLYIGGEGGMSSTNMEDDGDHWVDVDPAELLLPARDKASAMSIEGYIANIKQTIRVSPATTIKNLSHSPYRSSKTITAATSAAAEGIIDVAGMSDEDGDDGIVDASLEDGLEEDNGMDDDDWGSDEDDEEFKKEGELSTGPEVAGRSLFLSIWSTLDELFGGSLQPVFDLSAPMGGGSGPAISGPAAPAPIMQQTGSNDDSYSRPPIALEQQNAQHAFIKLLQRGIHAAETEMDLLQRHLRLAEDRAKYHGAKRRLLADAAAALQRRSNAQQFARVDVDVGAGAGLQAAGWTLIGILIIDAIILKLQLGPLSRAVNSSDQQNTRNSATAGGESGSGGPAGYSTDSSNVGVTSSTSSGSSSGTGRGRDVATVAWGEMVESLGSSVLRAAERRGSNMGSSSRLRDGDLHVLRSYFDYV
mmetsp:Transcript_26956/g.53983  ORF Transcript_26956/g.53983 Transcript_26956/m.53983 type:complete len:639 (-) Transcript_26956:6-1922(-)